MLDVIIDQDTPVYGEFARLYEKFIGFPTLPVAVGVGGTPIPRPERLYFWFGEPIDATRFGSSADDHAAAQALHEEVKQAVVMGIQFLRDERDRDPNRSLLPRLLGRVD